MTITKMFILTVVIISDIRMAIIWMFILTAVLSVDCANIQVPEGKSVEDIFSTLKTFRTNILDLISNGFTTPVKVKPPLPPPEKYRPLVIPSPPPRLPQEYPQALHYVTGPPNLGQNSHPIFEVHEPYPKPPPFPIIDIKSPPEVQFFGKPLVQSTLNIPDTVFTVFTLPTVGTDDLEEPVNELEEFNKEVEETLHAGPESFVDSERVNAGIEVESVLSEEDIKNIPKDLWREDLTDIKSKKHNHS